MNLVHADAHAEGIRVTTRYGNDLAVVRANEIQLQQVLLNLTRNAVDAMRGTLNKDLGIEIETQNGSDGGVQITVADHGPGVSSHLGEAVFHPFETTKREGLGVGLAISRTIIQSCGGTLTYRDNPVGGAVFAVDLPSAKDDDSERQQEEAAAER